jgi:hypothetical protein
MSTEREHLVPTLALGVAAVVVDVVAPAAFFAALYRKSKKLQNTSQSYIWASVWCLASKTDRTRATDPPY